MSKKKDLNDLINEFLEIWDCESMTKFLEDVIPVVELYYVLENEDWVEKEVGGDEENVQNIRLIRTAYLMSRISDFHCGKLCSLRYNFKDLWKRMEKNEN